MKKIVLDMQSRLYAKAIRRLLVQELDNYQVVISKSPSETAKQCNLLPIVSEPELAENVKNAKQSGLIDAFLFTSTTENYLVAVMDSL